MNTHICTECGEECEEIYCCISETNYSQRDHDGTYREYGYGSSCHGAEMERIEEEEELNIFNEELLTIVEKVNTPLASEPSG